MASGTVSFVALGSCTIAANQAGGGGYAPAPQSTQTFAITYNVVGFAKGAANPPTMNSEKAGKGVTLGWRLLDAAGAPVTGLTSATIRAVGLSCGAGTTPDLPLERSSGFRHLGNGNYQVTWQTPSSYAKSCKTMHLDLGEGMTHQAFFQFK
jgi:hypothetical protein